MTETEAVEFFYECQRIPDPAEPAPELGRLANSSVIDLNSLLGIIFAEPDSLDA